MFYQLYELNHAALTPYRALADATKLFYDNPLNPLSQTVFGRSITATCELFERTTRSYAKPEFNLPTTIVDGVEIDIKEKIVWSKPFCKLIHFKRSLAAKRAADPKILDCCTHVRSLCNFAAWHGRSALAGCGSLHNGLDRCAQRAAQ